jgi:hypothetical protein
LGPIGTPRKEMYGVPNFSSSFFAVLCPIQLERTILYSAAGIFFRFSRASNSPTISSLLILFFQVEFLFLLLHLSILFLFPTNVRTKNPQIADIILFGKFWKMLPNNF